MLRNCWDNAPPEYFFSHMKDEVDFSVYQTLDEVILKVNEYIEYYNNYKYKKGLTV